MDDRCLYGHRVSKDFAWVIQQRVCPVCGAPTVSVAGYQLARRLAGGLSIEAVHAFKTVRMLEEEYVLVPREQAAEGDGEASEEGFEDIPTTSAAAGAPVDDASPMAGENTDRSFADGPPTPEA